MPKGLNSTKIEWCDATWSPITGCLHGCPFCYARGFALRLKGQGHPHYVNGFEPAFHPDILDAPSLEKKPQLIFVGSMSDVFGEWVPEEWICEIMLAILKAPWHIYTILTKNPARAVKRSGSLFRMLNVWVGTSITGGDDADGGWRLGDLPELPQNRVLSLEPMLSRVPPECLDNVFSAVDWLIIGGLTGRKPFTPPREWVEPLVEWGRARGVPVFLKDSVRYPEIVREYPAAISAVRQKPAGVPGEWGMCDDDEC